MSDSVIDDRSFHDPEDVRWYRDEAMRIAQIALQRYGADMDGRDRQNIADEIYRSVKNAIERYGQVKRDDFLKSLKIR